MITATIKPLKEILNSEQIIEYNETYIKFSDSIWLFELNELIGKKIELTKRVHDELFKYEYNDIGFKKSWLKNIIEEVDWSKIPVDTKILVRDFDTANWNRRYFAKYENGKVWCFLAGRNSWSANPDKDFTDWNMSKLADDEDFIPITPNPSQYCSNCTHRYNSECKFNSETISLDYYCEYWKGETPNE